MSARVPRLVLAGLLAAGLASAPVASADDAVLTPAGAATLRGMFFGPMPAIAFGPQVAVGWTVTVGPGGNGGPVHLQLVSGDDRGTVVASAPAVDLPAAAGAYTFAIPVGQGLRSPSGSFDGLALAQEVGGHAILRTVDGSADWAVDVFTPALADDARDVPRTTRVSGERLAITLITEPDADHDGLGDRTQDGGDLRIVSARVADHRADRALVVAQVRNVGQTTPSRPTLSVPDHGFFPCYEGACGTAGPLAPGAEATLRLWVDLQRGEPLRAVVGSEGVDSTPDDNVAALAPYVTLKAAAKPAATGGGVRVVVGVARAGSVRLAARAGGVDFGRSLRFGQADRRTITLLPRRAADRRRLAAALRRPGRLAALVTADAGGGATALRLKL